MIIVLKNLKTKKLLYFSGYDITNDLLIHWTADKRDATRLNNEDLRAILNYINIHIDKTRFKVDIAYN